MNGLQSTSKLASLPSGQHRFSQSSGVSSENYGFSLSVMRGQLQLCLQDHVANCSKNVFCRAKATLRTQIGQKNEIECYKVADNMYNAHSVMENFKAHRSV